MRDIAAMTLEGDRENERERRREKKEKQRWR